MEPSSFRVLIIEVFWGWTSKGIHLVISLDADSDSDSDSDFEALIAFYVIPRKSIYLPTYLPSYPNGKEKKEVEIYRIKHYKP